MRVNDETKKYIHHPGGQFTLEKNPKLTSL